MITAFMRTVILYFLIMIGLRLVGKRQIGELEPSELVLTMMISDLATVPMQDFGIPLAAGVIPILTLLSLSVLLSQLSLRSLRFREIMCGTPAVLIREGVLQQKAMRENRYTLDELLEELRGQGIFRIEDAGWAVLENSGQLSVLPRTEKGTLPAVLINDGRVLGRQLAECGLDRPWLDRRLREQGLSGPEEAFLLTLDEKGRIFCVKKEGKPS